MKLNGRSPAPVIGLYQIYLCPPACVLAYGSPACVLAYGSPAAFVRSARARSLRSRPPFARQRKRRAGIGGARTMWVAGGTVRAGSSACRAQHTRRGCGLAHSKMPSVMRAALSCRTARAGTAARAGQRAPLTACYFKYTINFLALQSFFEHFWLARGKIALQPVCGRDKIFLSSFSLRRARRAAPLAAGRGRLLWQVSRSMS